MFTSKEWADTQDRFATFAADRLDDPANYFEDWQELDRLEEVAFHLGVDLTYDYDEARNIVSEAVEAREREAMEDVEPDDVDDRSAVVHPVVQEMREIDAMFAALG